MLVLCANKTQEVEHEVFQGKSRGSLVFAGGRFGDLGRNCADWIPASALVVVRPGGIPDFRRRDRFLSGLDHIALVVARKFLTLKFLAETD